MEIILKLISYFDRKILEGELKVKGRIQNCTFKECVKSWLFNHEVREIWKNFKG